jgi:glycosyltransferase involved in cell wall biosynthesis
MSGPDFSIVIPTYERPQALLRCVGALEKLEAGGPRFEVLVVDDGGGSALPRLLEPLRARLPLTLLRQEHAGPGAARNLGVSAARGRWVAFTDDDCMPEPGWLAGFAGAFARVPDGGLGGRTLNLLGANLYATATQLLVDYVSQPHPGAGPPRFFASSNLAFPAEPLRALGGFDASFPFAAGEDRDLCERWLAAGHPLAGVPDAVVRHDHPLGLARFCRMHHRYGRGARRFRRKLAARDGGRVRLEPAGFYVGLLLAPLAAAPARRAAPLCAALLLSQLCHAAGYAWERWSEPKG